jgi:DNA-binding NtrC family response regulator
VSGEDLQLSKYLADNNNNNDEPLAKLLVVDDDSDIVQVLKMGLLKNRFLEEAFTNPDDALQSFKSDAELLLVAVRHEDAGIVWNANSKKSQTD